MKKHILTWVLSLSLSIGFSQTNKYFPFPTSNAAWCDSVGLHQGYVYGSCGKYSYTFNGNDTLVNGKTYHQLIKTGMTYSVGGAGAGHTCLSNYPPYSYQNGYIGALRQDTVARKIYYLPPNAAADSLLYDFSLHVGDTVRTYILQACLSTPITVTAIDSILIGTSYRKRWIVNQGTCLVNGQLIEGIGSNFGLLEGLISYGGGGYPIGNLYCFSQNYQALYPYYNPSNGCNMVTGIYKPSENENITIWPNPTNNQFTIETNSSDKQTINLFDFNGGLILSQTINSKTTIDASSFNEGIYTLSIKMPDRVVNKKLVVIH